MVPKNNQSNQLKLGQCQKWGKNTLSKLLMYNGFDRSMLMIESGQNFVNTGLRALTLRGIKNISLLKFGRDGIEKSKQQWEIQYVA